MNINLHTLYSGTFSAGQYDISPSEGLNYSLYNTYGRVVPYYQVITHLTKSITLNANQTVVFELQYHIPTGSVLKINNNNEVKYNSIDAGTVENPSFSGSFPYVFPNNSLGPSTLNWRNYSTSITAIGQPYKLLFGSDSKNVYECMDGQALYMSIATQSNTGIVSDNFIDSNDVLAFQQLPLTAGVDSIKYLSYTNNTDDTQTVGVALVYGATQVWRNSYKAILYKNFNVTTYKPITEISEKGIFIFNNPSQYMKLTATIDNNSTKSSAIASFKTLYVDNLYAGNIEGGKSGGGIPIGGGGIDGGGTANTIAMWQDGDSIKNSPLVVQPTGMNINSTHTISAPVYSGSGFYPSHIKNGTAAIGKLPAKANISNKSIKEVLDLMLNYSLPTVTTMTLRAKVNGDITTIPTGTIYLQGSTIEPPFTLSNTVTSGTNINDNSSKFRIVDTTTTNYDYDATNKYDASVVYQNDESPAKITLTELGASKYTSRMECVESLGTKIYGTAHNISVGNYVYVFTHSTLLAANEPTLKNYTESAIKYLLTGRKTGDITLAAGFHYILWPKDYGVMVTKPMIRGSSPAAYMTYASSYNIGDGNTPIIVKMTNINGHKNDYYVIATNIAQLSTTWVLS